MNGIAESYALMLLAAVLLVLEIFVPSGGLISILAGIALIGSIIVAFAHGTAFGTLQVILSAILVPALLAMMVRWWPHSTMGRLILNIPPEGNQRLSDSGADESLSLLVGRIGKAKSKMLPSGAIRIDGRTFDAVTRGVAIAAGEYVEVIEVKGTRIVVVPADEEQARADQGSQPPDENRLARPVEELIPDPFDDPLA